MLVACLYSYVEPGVVLSVVGSTLAAIDVRGNKVERKFLLGVDGGGIGSTAKHPSLSLVAVGEKGRNPNIYVFEYPAWKLVKVRSHGTREGSEITEHC